MKKYLIPTVIALAATFILLLFTGCSKEPVNPFLGTWRSTDGKTTYTIKNTNGYATGTDLRMMLEETADGQYLHIYLGPVVDDHYKVISINYLTMILSLNGKVIIFNRVG